MENNLTLQNLIDTLTFSNNIHICVLDMSGMLTGDILSLNPDNHIHSRKICSKAKLAPRGMRLCFSMQNAFNAQSAKHKRYDFRKMSLRNF